MVTIENVLYFYEKKDLTNMNLLLDAALVIKNLVDETNSEENAFYQSIMDKCGLSFDLD